MVSRTAFEQLGHSVILLFVSVIGMFHLFVFHTIILTSLCFTVDKFTTKLLILNLISFIIMLIVYLPTIKFYKIKIYYTLALPFSAFVYVIMTLTSALITFYYQVIHGKGGVIKINQKCISELSFWKVFRMRTFLSLPLLSKVE